MNMPMLPSFERYPSSFLRNQEFYYLSVHRLRLMENLFQGLTGITMRLLNFKGRYSMVSLIKSSSPVN
jgi:hypothetical protein